MNKLGLAIVIVASLAVGWLAASVTGTGGGAGTSTDAEVIRLQDEVARLRMALGERDPVLESGGGLKGRKPADDGKGGGAGGSDMRDEPEPMGDVESFDIREFDDADKAFRALLSYATTMFKRGEQGHLALLDTINATFFEKPGEKITKDLVGSEERAARFLYPLVRFAMNHDNHVADMTETVFKTMAENPKRLAKLDNDTLQIFTEGIAYMLPGMVGPKRLERFTGYGRDILDQSEALQPRPVQRVRRDIQQALASWAPPVTSEEALLRLQQGNLSPEEALAMLSRMDPKDVARLDLDALVGPMVEHDPFRVLSTLSRLKVDDVTRAKLDDRLIQSVAAGKVPQTAVGWWLRIGGRLTWPKARDFIEQGLRQASTETAGVFLLAALDLRPPPPDDWVDWAERTYEFSDRVRLELKRRRGSDR